MTDNQTISRNLLRQVRPDTTRHLYAVGQAVRLKGGFQSRPSIAGIYRITGTLPSAGAFPQYRIRNDDERHERVTTQDKLTPVNTSSGEGATLIERTFGHG
ncbi:MULTISPECIES: hypothetical protein [unclassified Shinella]|uniref:hypothetical protein n=1 Tax=unclassified Shinella TaxID=2643062 RepID=UPI00225C82A5|nr:hypothetical protein [Shinella sp. YE25]MDC7254539.1 hypothetical protein [Shinella sp. YE25]CAI0337253.1 conserved hypothetical protein [Rhizobiaceae bacterium]CAK7255755.1 conserved protein of unknown function [Shinella sp. WSC3-e]